MTASLTICAAAISVRLDSSKSKVPEVFPSFPAIGMCPTVISPPTESFHPIEVGGRRLPTKLKPQEAGQPGKCPENAPPRHNAGRCAPVAALNLAHLMELTGVHTTRHRQP